MPELPEVQTIVNDLSESIINLKIKEVQISNKLIWRNNKSANSTFVNLRILDIVRKGKNILIHLSASNTLIIHLKMTGKLVYKKVFLTRDVVVLVLFLIRPQTVGSGISV